MRNVKVILNDDLRSVRDVIHLTIDQMRKQLNDRAQVLHLYKEQITYLKLTDGLRIEIDWSEVGL